MTTPSASGRPDHKPRPFIDLLVSIVIPSLILMKLSGDEYLGSVNALVIGLAFPLGWGLFELIRYGKKNFIAVLGLISVGLTGGIGLLELDAGWLAIKEAAIPAVIGLAVLVSSWTKYPLVRTLMYNRNVLDVDKIHQALEANGNVAEFEGRLLKATYFFAGTFLFSSIMNYLIAKWIVVSPSGTQAFNEELGQMTLVSYPMIAIPSMIMMMLIFYYLWRTIRRLTGFTLEEVMAPQLRDEQKAKDYSESPSND
ncbi:MFS transporter [Marinobacter salinisoli]|uniref:MFS transporter n=1 Tax=Marinobacter salinisoli TaxID=2769486 RepID=A0ABX7MT57_9GAMM|nr:VC0807 family protein [Marinobacter salinisoli]QSP95575.1 MFS transporter [Marinobacter salinisoli]